MVSKLSLQDFFCILNSQALEAVNWQIDNKGYFKKDTWLNLLLLDMVDDLIKVHKIYKEFFY